MTPEISVAKDGSPEDPEPRFRPMDRYGEMLDDLTSIQTTVQLACATTRKRCGQLADHLRTKVDIGG